MNKNGLWFWNNVLLFHFDDSGSLFWEEKFKGNFGVASKDRVTRYLVLVRRKAVAMSHQDDNHPPGLYM